MNKKLLDFIGTEVSYDDMGTQIWGIQEDGGHQLLLEVRGWGAIQNLFKKKGGGIDTDKAAEFQDEMAEFFVEGINEWISIAREDS